MTDPTKPVPSVRAALQALLAAMDCVGEDAHEAVASAEADARAALAAPFGLSVEQEPKYTANDFGKLVTRRTGIAIPDDEPTMTFRAKDIHAAPIIMRYHDLILETGSTFVDSCFERAQAFIKFRERYPERMRKPD